MAARANLPGTLWSQIQSLDEKRSEATRAVAWKHLVDVYQPAMVNFVRGLLRGAPAVSVDDAEDIVQSFLTACVEKEWLSTASAERGSFRGFVFKCLKNFTWGYIRFCNRQRRRPADAGLVGIEPVEQQLEAGMDASFDSLLRAEWAQCLAAAALARVEERSKTNAALLDAQLNRGVSKPDELAMVAGVGVGGIRAYVKRARTMFAEELWAELKESVADEGELEEERTLLMPFLSGYLSPSRNPSFFKEDLSGP